MPNNIIFYFTDQQRWDTCGCFGQPLNITPNLDRLAREIPEAEVLVPDGAPHILPISLPGYKSEVVVRFLSDRGVYLSSGSACHRGRPSHVFAALGLPLLYEGIELVDRRLAHNHADECIVPKLIQLALLCNHGRCGDIDLVVYDVGAFHGLNHIVHTAVLCQTAEVSPPCHAVVRIFHVLQIGGPRSPEFVISGRFVYSNLRFAFLCVLIDDFKVGPQTGRGINPPGHPCVHIAVPLRLLFLGHGILHFRRAVLYRVLQGPVHHLENGFGMLAVQAYADETVHRITIDQDGRLLSVQRQVRPYYPIRFGMLYLVAVQRPVGNPPGTGHDSELAGHDVADHLGIRCPDIICRKVFLEISLVVPLVELGQDILVLLTDAGIFQCAIVVDPTTDPGLIGMEERREISQLGTKVVLAGRKHRSSSGLHQLVAKGLKLLDSLRQLFCGSDTHILQLVHIVVHLGSHLCRIRTYRQSIQLAVLFADIDEIAVEIVDILQIRASVHLIGLGQVKQSALTGQILEIVIP